MQVIINRNALCEALSVATSVVASRTTKETLKCVRLTAEAGGLIMGATDVEVALRVNISQVEVKKPGDLLVPAEKLAQIAKESMDETLALEGDEQNCHIRGQDSHFEVYGQDPKEFPPIPDLEGVPDVELEAADLQMLLERTIFAVAKENTRYAINGVLWEKQGKKLCLVATDGRRLAKAAGTVTQAHGEDAMMIVPAKTLSILQRVLGNATGQVAVKFSGNQVTIRSDGYVLSSALVEGQFPNYDEVIPKDNNKVVEVSVADFTSAVKRAALLTNEQSKGIRLSFSKNKLVLSSRAPEQGEATISMQISYEAEPLDVGFNPAFLLDALRAAGQATVTLELKESNRPGVLKVGTEFVYVVMPVSLS